MYIVFLIIYKDVFLYNFIMNNKLNIGFDAKRVFLNKSGLGNYSRDLITALNKYYPNNNYYLFTTKKTDLYNFNDNKIILPPNNTNKSLWRAKKIPSYFNNYNITVYHGLSNELPLTIKEYNVKKIVTIHDLIFLRYPQWYKYFDRKIYDRKFRMAANKADKIIAISEQTKNDIVNFYNINPDKITVVYQTCNDNFKTLFSVDKIKELKQKFNLPNNYLLYVGTIEPRKNLLTILKSLIFGNIDFPLVVVGKKTKYIDTIKKYIDSNNLKNKVIFVENISTPDLAKLYQGADIFIYPSIFEGFGIPIIEALYSKTPVITSKEGCFSEAGGKSSIYINPNNYEELAEKINLLLNNSELRKDMSETGFKYVKKFNDKNLAEKIIQVYHS